MVAASALVLAGGRSSRMGRDKASLPFGDGTLIEHLVASLAPRFADILVIASPAQLLPPLDARIVRDDIAYDGPAAGLAAGLRAMQNEVAFVTSCDGLGVHLPLVEFLLSEVTGHDAVLPVWDGRPQPLRAVYRRTALGPLEQQLALGGRRLLDLFDAIKVRPVGEGEIRRFDAEGRSFVNLNTPADSAEARRRLEME
jgi:molybdopterin-guanine dinucleotide biosynthesis protein A